MQIQVTAEHIANGRATACSKCPIALAIHDELLLVPRVCHNVVYIENEKINLPHVAKKFIHYFDSTSLRHRAKPFSFDLPIPKEYYKHCED